MRKDLLSIMACPECKGNLVLNQQSDEQSDIVTGTLTCDNCKHTYPIVDSIPNLLPPDLANDHGDN